VHVCMMCVGVCVYVRVYGRMGVCVWAAMLMSTTARRPVVCVCACVCMGMCACVCVDVCVRYFWKGTVSGGVKVVVVLWYVVCVVVVVVVVVWGGLRARVRVRMRVCGCMWW